MKRSSKVQSIYLCYGSDTGNTEKSAHNIAKSLENFGFNVTFHDITQANLADFPNHDALIFGLSTWYYGEPQADWEDTLPLLKEMVFPKLAGKPVALFGCGDQQDYADNFCDAMGWLANALKPYQVHFSGNWPVSSYQFRNSKALIDKETFVGLPLDMDRQAHLTDARIARWTELLYHAWSGT